MHSAAIVYYFVYLPSALSIFCLPIVSRNLSSISNITAFQTYANAKTLAENMVARL